VTTILAVGIRVTSRFITAGLTMIPGSVLISLIIFPVDRSYLLVIILTKSQQDLEEY
jgi:hypothetical protein